MRGILFVLLCCACGPLVGCASTSDNVLKSRDHNEVEPFEYHDEWESVRKEGRGSEATEKEWDSWTPKLMSPRAMAIERNLGYGY